MNDTDAKTRILRVATRLFGQKGFGGTSVREVVDAAGVTKPTLYYWFQDKASLFVEAVESQHATFAGILARTRASRAPVPERLRAFVRDYIASAEADPDGVLLMVTALHTPADDGRPEVDLLSAEKQGLHVLAELLDAGRREGSVRADVDPLHGALSLLGAANMHIVASLYGLPHPDAAADHIVDLFLRGVTP